MAQQFDASEAFQKVCQERAQRRNALRQEFLKRRTNPMLHGEGGTVFDPAIYRYQAAQVTLYEHFRPTLVNGLKGFGFILMPMIVFGYFLHKDRSAKEAKYRRGEVAYKDRRFKFA